MNKRIRKIAEETIRFRLDPDSKQYEAQIHPEDLTDFAEALIKECARIADMVSENKVEWVGGNILVYFGVKE